MNEGIIKNLFQEEYLIDAEKLELLSQSSKMVYIISSTNNDKNIFDLYLKKENVSMDTFYMI